MRKTYNFYIIIVFLLCLVPINMEKAAASEIKTGGNNPFEPETTNQPLPDRPAWYPGDETNQNEVEEQNEKEERTVANYLSIPNIEQENGFWCWAACLEMMASYRNNYKSQLTIATYVFDKDDPYQGADEIKMKKGVNYVNNNRNKEQTKGEHSLTMSKLQEMIDDGNPIPLSMRFHRGGGHTILAKGYNTITNTVQVNDPQDKDAVYTISMQNINNNAELWGEDYAVLDFMVTYVY